MIVVRISLQAVITILLVFTWAMLALIVGYGGPRQAQTTSTEKSAAAGSVRLGAAAAFPGASSLAQPIKAEIASTIRSESDLINFSFTPSPRARANPLILSKMMESANARFAEAVAWARESRETIDPQYWRRHELEISDYDAFADERLISIGRTIYADGGGAHPNIELDSLLWEVEGAREIRLTDLFRTGEAPEAVRAAWRKDLERQKNERFGDDSGATQLAEWLESDPVSLAEVPATLARSTEAGRAGGVVFLHGPYSVGAYVEGSYFVTVPQAVFADALKPAYRDSFAGAPAPD